MEFMKRNAGYSLLDCMRNNILDKIKVTPITEYLNNYRQNWLQHVKRMDRARIPKHVLICPHWTVTARKTEDKMVGDCKARSTRTSLLDSLPVSLQVKRYPVKATLHSSFLSVLVEGFPSVLKRCLPTTTY
jgi:hypothetical protein